MSTDLSRNLSNKVDRVGHTLVTWNVFAHFWKKKIKGDRLELLLEMGDEKTRERVSEKLDELIDIAKSVKDEFGLDQTESVNFEVNLDGYTEEGQENKRKLESYRKDAQEVIEKISDIVGDHDWYELIP